jgi:hypothetical protein
VPDGQDFHYVAGSAGQDKHPERRDHPVERDVLALVDEVDERERNRDIAEGDQAIGDHVGPQQIGTPHIAMPVGHEALVGQQRQQIVHFHFLVVPVIPPSAVRTNPA